MSLSCGCEIRLGDPIDFEVLKAHYKHTMEAIFFWEILRRPATPQGDDHLKLCQAKLDLLAAIDKLYPEASKERP